MDQFVCVRLVKANGLDLELFQFDFDMTFAVFFLRADRTIYGRYGTRSDHEEAERDISLEGFAAALEGVLRLHATYPDSRRYVAGKQPPPTDLKKPGDFPSLRDKYEDALDYQGNVVRSCLHCHQIRQAERSRYRDAGEPIPDQVLFPWPLPDTIGLAMDPRTRATIRSVAPDSAAERAGLRAGDELLTLDGQALVSTADLQWVLHRTESGAAELPAVIRRGRSTQRVAIQLPDDWRRGDISWRVTTWELRRMATGGLKLETATEAQRRAAGIAADRLALHVFRAGKYGPHAAARRAGFREGDLIVEVEGRDAPLTETQLIALMVQERKKGAEVPVTVVRDGRRIELAMPTQ